MTSKERVIAALQRREPDRVPTGENYVDGSLAEALLGETTLYNKGWEELDALWGGRREAIVVDYIRTHVNLVRKLGWDYVRVPAVPIARVYSRPRMTGDYSWVDDKGVAYHFNPAVGNVIQRAGYPDMAIADLPRPSEPISVDRSELEAIEGVVKALGDTHFIVGRLPVDGTFPAEVTIGMEEFLMRMITEPEFVHRAVDAYVTRSIAYLHAFFDMGVDAVMTTDDYADNRTVLMGPDRFRAFILPGLRRQCEAAHERGGYFIKHTDGNVWDILDDMIGAGIDAWHGIQPSIGMDLRLLKERYGNRLCFFGGVDCATLAAASPEEVRGEVRYGIRHAGVGGGLVLTSGNALEPGTRIENYRAMRQAIEEYGVYPIET